MLNLPKIISIDRKQELAVSVNVYTHFGVWQQATGAVASCWESTAMSQVLRKLGGGSIPLLGAPREKNLTF